jgi:hypothetical protein
MAVKWLEAPEAHDFEAATAYLSMLAESGTVTRTVDALRTAPMVMRAAKDILRAARLPLLPDSNAHVKSDLGKISDGKRLSPILLVRGDATRGVALQIADGYHRVCASYITDENTVIPCRLVAWTS